MAYKKGTQVGSFVLAEALSEHGGTAAVYKALVTDRHYQSRHGKAVALKLSHVGEQDSDIFETLLIKETDLLHDLRHPGIVRLCPITQFNKIQYFARAIELSSNPNEPTDAPWYFVMELLEGGTVADVIGDKKFPLDWCVELIYQIAIIIDYLHLRQVAHRDLKPSNIMFRAAPNSKQLPVPVMIDFGLAEKRRLRPEVSASTIAYAAPERVQRLFNAEKAVTERLIDHHAGDIWSLGIISYELITRAYPFVDKTERTALAYRLVNDEPEPISDTVPPHLKALILDMLQKEPEKRPLIEDIIIQLETQIEIIAPRL